MRLPRSIATVRQPVFRNRSADGLLRILRFAEAGAVIVGQWVKDVGAAFQPVPTASRRTGKPLLRNERSIILALLCLTWFNAAATCAAAQDALPAESTLRSDAETDRAVVRLTDVAQLGSADRQAFGHTILGLLPPDGRPLVLQRDAIQARLQQIYGTSAPTLGGAPAVRVARRAEPSETGSTAGETVRMVNAAEPGAPAAPAAQSAPGPSTEENLRPSSTLPDPGVRAAVEEALQHAIGGREALWEAKIVWTDRAVQQLGDALRIAEARAAEEPSAGMNVFHITYRTGDTSSILPLHVELQEAPYGLSVVSPLRRGHVIAASDFRRRALAAKPTNAQPFTDPSDVVGKEVKQSIPTGGWLAPDNTGPVTVVHRYDLVEVQVLAGGITITTSGEAKQDGAVGDLVNVETSDPKRTLIARVVGPSRVQIVTRPPTVAGETGP